MHHLTKLPEWGLISLQGPESGQFAQAQLTSDIEQLSPPQLQLNNNTAQLTAYCEPKGRVIANGYVFCPASDHYLLALHSSLIESVAARLKMYVFRTKVQIAVDNLHGMVGFNATAEPASQCEWSGTTILAQCPVVPKSELMIGVINLIAARQIPDDPDHWRRANLLSGLPLVEMATSEQFTPQMLNLDQLGAVSFSKGCYPGQEIVARTHYLGKVKRRLRQVKITATEQPSPGATIHARSGAVAGTLVAAVPDGGGKWDGLAVVHDSAAMDTALVTKEQAATIVITKTLRPGD